MTLQANARARAVAAAGPDWHRVVVACLDQLEPLPPGANFGVAYLGEQLAPVADAVIEALRRCTAIESWLGACGGAALGGDGGPRENGLAVLVARLPEGGFRIAPSLRIAAGDHIALVHAALDEADPAGPLRELVDGAASRTLGGLVAAARAPVHFAAGTAAGSGVCLGLGGGVPAVTGLAASGSPLGPPHRVTSALGPLVLALDGRPALAVMEDELGDLFRRVGDRHGRELWLAHASEVRATGAAAPPLRRVTVADRARGALRVEGGRLGGSVRLIHPDPGTSLERLAAMGRQALSDLRGHRPCAGLYLTSRHRGAALFGRGTDELAILRAEIGGVPLIGSVTDAEIFEGVMHEGAGVLLLLGEAGA